MEISLEALAKRMVMMHQDYAFLHNNNAPSHELQELALMAKKK